MRENPVVVAAKWAAKVEPPPQKNIDTNYSYIARLLGVKRQVVQRYKKSGRFPPDHVATLVEASNGALSKDVLAAVPASE